MTYSIVARDPATGQMGVAVESRYFSVGSVVTWGEPGVGVVATQSMARIEYGPDGLALMRSGMPAPEALSKLLSADSARESRQVAMLDAMGRVGAHTGTRCIADAGHHIGDQYSVQANLMANDTVWPEMARAFESTQAPLARRLLAALQAAQDAGGDLRGQQSAAILIVSGDRSEPPWKRVLELRIEDHPRPVEELARLMRLAHGFELTGAAEEALASGDIDRSVELFARANEVSPGHDELQFWTALALGRAGRVDEASQLFREVFRANPPMAELVRRLPAAGILPNDQALIERITSLRD
jgi:uncharacterized Ntn-hydrolase superfamily protein